MRILETLTQEQINTFRNLSRQWRRQLDAGFFYAEGERVFASLLQSRIEIEVVLMTPELFEGYRRAMASCPFEILIADKNSIERILERRMNQGVIAFARIPDQRPLQEVVNQERFCVVALNGIDHAVNVGSILRNCAAFNVSAVILDAVTVHPYCWRSVQASVGGVFQVPFYVASDLALLLKRIRGEGAMLVAADPSGGMVLADLKIPEKVCLILGNEHRGISTNILSLRPERTVIPIEKVDSLNVAAASAIFLHEISLRWNV